MILEKEKRDILIGGAKTETTFDIDADSMHIIFSILRDKMYKDPRASICREVISNCRDSHREAGCPDKPVECHISDKRNSIFFEDGLNIIFRDFGVGLSPDRVKNIYSKYGASTKRGSNNQTGGFGLGAKTPFAYTEAFTVHTIFDGVEYTYYLYIDETQKGKIVCMEQKDTDKGNMTEIIIPLDEGDRDKFEAEVIQSTTFWDVRPNLIGFKKSYPEMKLYESKYFKDVEGDRFKVINNFGYSNGPVCAIVDGIYYPVDLRAIESNYSDLPYNNNWQIALEFETGEVGMAANRETLNYDSKGKLAETINARMKDVMEAIGTQLKDFVLTQPALWQAHKIYNSLSKQELFKLSVGAVEMKYKTPSGNEVDLNDFHPKISMIKMFTSTLEWSGEQRYQKKKEIEGIQNLYEYSDALFLMKHDHPKNKGDKLYLPYTKTIVRDFSTKYIAVIEPVTSKWDKLDDAKKAELWANFRKEQELLKELGLTDIMTDYFDVEPDKTTNAGYTRNKDQVKLNTFVKGNFEKGEVYDISEEYLAFGEEEITDIVYLEVEDERAIKLECHMTEELKRISRYFPDVRIVTVSKWKMKHMAPYQSLKDYVADNRDYIENLNQRHQLNEVLSSIKHWKELTFTKEIEDTFDELKEWNKVAYYPVQNFIGALIYITGYKPDNYKSEVKKYEDARKEVINTYPLLDKIEWSSKKAYVALVNENVELKKQLEEINQTVTV